VLTTLEDSHINRNVVLNAPAMLTEMGAADSDSSGGGKQVRGQLLVRPPPATSIEEGKGGGSPGEFLPRAQVLGEDDSWRENWDSKVGQKMVFAPPAAF
jgi:hypothetical protein